MATAIPSALANVDFKHTLSSHITYHQTIIDVVKIIQDIPNYSTLKLDDELTLYVCKVVENLIRKHHRIDKKLLVIKCLSEAFSLTPSEQIIVSRTIDFLWHNRKITKTSLRKAVSRGVSGWIGKKLL